VIRGCLALTSLASLVALSARCGGASIAVPPVPDGGSPVGADGGLGADADDTGIAEADGAAAEGADGDAGAGADAGADDDADADADANDAADSAPTACSGPPARLSLGAYPMGIDQWVDEGSPYGAALVGTVQEAGTAPMQCSAPPEVADSFQVDQVLWSYRSAAWQGTTLEVDHAPGFTAGQRLVVFGDDEGCSTGFEAVQFLDLALYPMAVADMQKLHAFVADRADYQRLVASEAAVDATLTAVVYRPPDCFNNPFASYDLTLQIHQSLCGTMAPQVTAHYQPQPGDSPPAAGARFVLFLGPFVKCDVAPPDDYEVLYLFPADQWPRLSSLRASPPSLSL
jgi:hypothetical protein